MSFILEISAHESLGLDTGWQKSKHHRLPTFCYIYDYKCVIYSACSFSSVYIDVELSWKYSKNALQFVGQDIVIVILWSYQCFFLFCILLIKVDLWLFLKLIFVIVIIRLDNTEPTSNSYGKSLATFPQNLKPSGIKGNANDLISKADKNNIIFSQRLSQK